MQASWGSGSGSSSDTAPAAPKAKAPPAWVHDTAIPADPSPPQWHGARESPAIAEENPWQDLVETPAFEEGTWNYYRSDADAAQAPDAARAPVQGGMQDVNLASAEVVRLEVHTLRLDTFRPRPGEKHMEILYCVSCKQFTTPECFHKAQQKWTLPSRVCIVCRDAE